MIEKNSVEPFIQKMILYYPTLYKHKDPEISKQKVLNILCGLGSGAEWSEDGNLALYFPDYKEYTIYNLESKYRALERRVEDYIYAVENTKDVKEKALQLTFLKVFVKSLNAPEETDEYIGWEYLDEKYSLILNIPDTIQPDWLDACRYVKAKLIEYYTTGIDEYIKDLESKPESVYQKTYLQEYKDKLVLKKRELKKCDLISYRNEKL